LIFPNPRLPIKLKYQAPKIKFQINHNDPTRASRNRLLKIEDLFWSLDIEFEIWDFILLKITLLQIH